MPTKHGRLFSVNQMTYPMLQSHKFLMAVSRPAERYQMHRALLRNINLGERIRGEANRVQNQCTDNKRSSIRITST